MAEPEWRAIFATRARLKDKTIRDTGDVVILRIRIRNAATQLTAVLLLFVALVTSAFAKPQWQSIKLKNGLEVIVVENRSVPLVTIEIAVKNGSYTEPPDYNGLSHLYEHMFFKTNERSREEGYLERVAEGGIFRNAQTREEVVNYYATCVKTSLRSAMTIMRDAIRYPLFDQRELENERVVVLDEFSRNESNPFYHLTRAVDLKLWYKYYSRKNPLGERDVIATATPEKMRTIQSKFYVPNNSALIVAGDVTAAEIFKMAEEMYGDWTKAEDPFIKNPLVTHPPLTKDEAVIVTQPVQAATLFISYHGPSTDTDAPATYAADVFSFVLRQPDSKFARALIDTGLTTAAGIGYLTQRNVGPIQVTAQTTPDKLKAAIKAINAEIARFDALDYITDEQLESAKQLLEVNEIFSREKPSEYAHTVSFWWASSGLDYYGSYIENLRKVTKADIKRYVEKYIKGKKRVVGVMLSAEDKQRIGLTEQDLLVK
ncbi:MAG TPA: pitrilysin family protein [Blastocatellia bacterium]|nr:pitrilysin family protein [Blastocatellia bacterium]